MISDNFVRDVRSSGFSSICDTDDDVTQENFKSLRIDGVVGGLDMRELNCENLGIDDSDKLEAIREIDMKTVNEKNDELEHESQILKHKNILQFECIDPESGIYTIYKQSSSKNS